MVAHVGCKPHIVGDDDHCAPFGGEVFDDLHDLLLQFWIKRACGLVKQQGLGFHAQGTRDGGTLLLATRQLRRIDIAFVADADLIKVFACGCFYL